MESVNRIKEILNGMNIKGVIFKLKIKKRTTQKTIKKK
jgi:uncharacterized protein YqgV (UPF0045/DUF77 family)